jgi:hypothetical protein
VRSHEEGDAVVGSDVEKKLKDRRTGVLVEGARRLVCQQNLGVVHQSADDGSALALATRKLLDFLMEPVGEACALRELMEALEGKDAMCARSDGGDKAILLQGEVRNEIVKLEDEADFVAKETKRIAAIADVDAVDDDVAAIGEVEAATQMEQSAFAATRRTAECDGFALVGLEVYAAKDCDRAIFETLPYTFGMENDATAASCDGGEAGHSKRSASTARIRMA